MDNEKYTLDNDVNDVIEVNNDNTSGYYYVNTPVNKYVNRPSIKFAKMGNTDVQSPVRETKYSAGIDFFIPDDWNDGVQYTIRPQEKIVIPMKICIDMIGSGLENYMLKFENKSGIAVKKGLVVGACVIDADYQGELMVHVYNASNEPTAIFPGGKIIQGIITEVIYASPSQYHIDDLFTTQSDRGAGRFGSTGD